MSERKIILDQKDQRKVEIGKVDVYIREPETEQVKVNPTIDRQTFYPTKGKYFDKVEVEGVTSDIDKEIKPSNIRRGVSILGVNGNLEPDKPDQTKTVKPTEEEQRVRGDVGFELGECIIEPIPKNYVGSEVARKEEILYPISDQDREIPAHTYLTGKQVIKGVVLDNATITPNDARQVIESKFDGLKQVIVEPVPSKYLDTSNPSNVYNGEVGTK